MTKPDTICEEYADRYPRKKDLPRLTVKLAPQTDDTVLIEGAPAALEFLGNLLLALSDIRGLWIPPGTAGGGLPFLQQGLDLESVYPSPAL
jgi:hypothetical protein